MPLPRTRIPHLPYAIGETVRISGWVDVVRAQKNVSFLVISEPQGQVQVTVLRIAHPETHEQVGHLLAGSVVSFVGEVVEAPQVKLGGLEILAMELEIHSKAEATPITPTSSLETRMDHRVIDLRSSLAQLVFAATTTAEKAMRRTFAHAELIELHSPKLMASPSESGAEVFEVSYFDRTAYLAQSPQFYKQMAIAARLGGGEGVFEIGPVFRAEPSFTTRHATEFISVDVELAFIDSVEDVMAYEEQMIVQALTSVQRVHGEALGKHGIAIGLPVGPFPRITLADAVKKLEEAGHTMERAGDLDPAGERLLGQLIKEETGSDFVFVTKWPTSLRPFYHMRDGEFTESFDLLYKGVEITTGAQREHRHDVLAAQAAEHELGSSVDYYLEFFRYGIPPHGGFGFGLARFMMLMLDQPSIRETSFLFRSPKRLTP